LVFDCMLSIVFVIFCFGCAVITFWVEKDRQKVVYQINHEKFVFFFKQIIILNTLFDGTVIAISSDNINNYYFYYTY